MDASRASGSEGAGHGPPGLALLLERGGARLVAGAREVAGARLTACEVAVRGRPRAVADCRTCVGAVTRLALVVPFAVLEGWVRGRLVGAQVGGWLVEQVRWDRSEGTGAWELAGRRGAEEVWLRVELGIGVRGGRVRVGVRRGWLLGPPEVTLARTWAAMRRRLRATGVGEADGGLGVDVGLAVLGEAFAGVGWRVPGAVAEVAVRVTEEGVEVRGGEAGWSEGQVGWSEGQVGWSKGQVVGGWPEGQVGWPEGQVGWSKGQAVAVAEVDVLAGVRGGLRAGRDERLAACARLQALAEERPALAGRLAWARVRALRFVDRDGCVAALREVLRGEASAEAWWVLAVVSRGSAEGLAEGLAGLLAVSGAEGVRLARALVLTRRPEGVAEARALLEGMVAEAATPAVWRALACVRAADPSARAKEVEAALTAALGEDGWRRRDEGSDLRAAVAEAVMRSGRSETAMATLLRRVLVGPRRGEADRVAKGPGLRRSAQIVADFYAQDGRWRELVLLLERELGRLGEAARDEALARIARLRHAVGGGPEESQ